MTRSMIISEADFYKRATELYGKDRVKWKFKCSGCGRIQSGESIIEQNLPLEVPLSRYVE